MAQLHHHGQSPKQTDGVVAERPAKNHSERRENSERIFESSHIEYNNDVVTKILSNLGIRHRDDLFYKIGNDEITPNENIKKSSREKVKILSCGI